MYPISWSILKRAALITVLAIIPVAALVVKLRTDRLSGDGPSYLDIAQAIASGKGFQEPHGLWPGHLTVRRPPLWPMVLSVPLRLFRTSNPLSVMYSTEVTLQAVTVFGAALLTWMLSGNLRRVFLAAFLVALWPSVQAYMVAGLSEPCSTAALTIGTVLLCLGGRWFFVGVFLVSLVPLARPNFMILPVWGAVVLLVLHLRRHPALKSFGSPRRLIAGGVLFFVPLGVWLIRNYTVTGGFPVIVTKAGEDLYGTYNVVSATVGGPRWGRWLPPDDIPGEEPLGSLALRMSEIEVSRYYQAKGLRFMTHRWYSIPGLIVGRVLFAGAPQWPPFGMTPTGDKYSGIYRKVEWICRIALYATAIIFLWRRRLRLDSWYGLILVSTALTTVTTVTLYFGWERFLCQLTVLLVLFVCTAGGHGGAHSQPKAAFCSSPNIHSDTPM